MNLKNKCACLKHSLGPSIIFLHDTSFMLLTLTICMY